MRHFGFLEVGQVDKLFYRPPQAFDRSSDVDLLSVALGATLYMPAIRPALAADIAKQTVAGATSVVMCLEDAVADQEVPAAEANLVEALHAAHGEGVEIPLLFVRVRCPEQIMDLCRRLGPVVHDLTGFVLPKFTASNGPTYLTALEQAGRATGTALRAMPVLESGAVLHAESRLEELSGLRVLLERHREQILAVRLGATDLCGLHGLRRPRELTIYDVGVVADLIADVVNMLGRTDGSGFTITGPVWEYYSRSERIFKPQLRTSPFENHAASDLRRRLVSRDLDGLIREIELDRANGLTGKTVIHPSHVTVVHALSVVPIEEYRDACDIVGREYGRGGVVASGYGNKMNELGPHRAWAKRTLLKAEVFGVAGEDVSFVDLLAASVP